MKIKVRNYIRYKFINSVFSGLSTGAVMIIYGLLQPSVFSVGGLILTLGILLISKQYNRLMNPQAYYYTTVFTEVVILIAMALILMFPKNEVLALAYYSLFTVVFIFGTYLMRFESNLFSKNKILSAIDSAKQIGNLIGLALSWFFYEGLKMLDSSGGMKDSWKQIYFLHWILVILQAVILFACLKSFSKNKITQR